MWLDILQFWLDISFITFLGNDYIFMNKLLILSLLLLKELFSCSIFEIYFSHYYIFFWWIKSCARNSFSPPSPSYIFWFDNWIMFCRISYISADSSYIFTVAVSSSSRRVRIIISEGSEWQSGQLYTCLSTFSIRRDYKVAEMCWEAGDKWNKTVVLPNPPKFYLSSMVTFESW